MTITESMKDAALVLREARRTRRPIGPISKSHGIEGLEAAYGVAELVTDAELATGRRITGKKVGLTSEAVQRQLGVDQPDFGVLFEDMEFLSGQDVPMSRLIQPKAEAEVAFIVGRDMDAHLPTWGEFMRCIEYALPAIEIVDSAIADWKIGLVDTIADNASSGLYVLGDQPVTLGSVQFGEVAMQMSKGDQVVSTGTGAACLGHPLRAAYWLARTMVIRNKPLRAGEIILSGALGPMSPVSTGNLVAADIGPVGRVCCRMV